MSNNTKPSESLKNGQRKHLEQETQERNAINRHYQAIKGNEEILAELRFFDNIRACQQFLAGQPMVRPDLISPHLPIQHDITALLPETLHSVTSYLSVK